LDRRSGEVLIESVDVAFEWRAPCQHGGSQRFEPGVSSETA
jgi:hypothetical protein